MEVKSLNVNRLVKFMYDAVKKMPNDGEENGYPSSRGLMAIAAMVIDDCVIGDNKEDVILPIAFTEPEKETSK